MLNAMQRKLTLFPGQKTGNMGMPICITAVHQNKIELQSTARSRGHKKAATLFYFFETWSSNIAVCDKIISLY